MADLMLYEFVVTCDERVEWFLLDPDEARALRGLIAELDPHLEVLDCGDVRGLVRAVTGAPPPEEERGWPPRPLG